MSNTLRDWAKSNLGPLVALVMNINDKFSGSLLNRHITLANKAYGIVQSSVPAFAPETFAQNGEDILVSSLLRARLRRQGREMSSVFYAEIGANQPITGSNTYLLYKQFGARGVLVEANPDLIKDLRAVRSRDTVVHTAVSTSRDPEITLHVGNAHELSSLRAEHVKSFGNFRGVGGVAKQVTVRNTHINDLLAEYATTAIDFLSVDCEGIDYDLLQAMNMQKYRPYIVQCEPSEHFDPGMGNRMIILLQQRGYELVAVTDVNLIFACVAAD